MNSNLIGHDRFVKNKTTWLVRRRQMPHALPMRLFFVSVFLLGAVEIAHSDESTPQEQRYDAIRADAAVMLSIRAAQFCYLSEARKRTKDEIATELKYAREGGGVVDKSKLYELQHALRSIDEIDRDKRKEWGPLKKGAKVPACSSESVRHLLDCLEHGKCPERDMDMASFIERES